MENKIVRKLTSLILMTIMFAGGLTFAFPNTIPEASASHNANLYVSAENPISSNIFSGPMVIEIVIRDDSIRRTDQSQGEPVVTANSRTVRMTQSNDGNWYAYIADRTQAQRADDTQPQRNKPGGVDGNLRGPGVGLDFGKFCNSASGANVLGFSVSSTEGIAIPGNVTVQRGNVISFTGTTHPTDGTAAFVTCSAKIALGRATDNSTVREMDVVRLNKTVAPAGTGTLTRVGQIGLSDTAYWPFIQLYDFVQTGDVVIKYDKGGQSQITTLKFDKMQNKDISHSLDRELYPRGAQVHFTLTDMSLNIDPTDEDRWTWGSNVGRGNTNSTFLFYQLFNRTSPNVGAADNPSYARLGAQNLFGNLTTLMFEGGDLTFDNNTQRVANDVVRLADNADSRLFVSSFAGAPLTHLRTNTLAHNSLPITLTESESNTGIFTTYDNNNISVLRVTDNAIRGTTATITYNSISRSIVVDTSYATISMDETVLEGEWNSGEILPVTLVDNDANLNSKVDEDLLLSTSATKLWPAIKVGSPITLASLTQNAGAVVVGAQIDRGTQAVAITRFGDQRVDTFSEVARLGVNADVLIANNGGLRFLLSTTGADLKTFLQNGTKEGTTTMSAANRQNGLFHYLNYDLRSFATNSTGANVLAGNTINITIGETGRNCKIGADSAIAGVQCGGHLKNLPTIAGLSGVSALSGIIDISNANATGFLDASNVEINFNFTISGVRTIPAGNYTAAVDLFRFGTSHDGDSATGVDRFNDAIYRMELQESDKNTSTFVGSIEYVMLNQININQTATYTTIVPISDEITMIVHEDLTGEDDVRVNYNDLAGDGTILPIGDQQAAPTHSGVVSLDFDNYKFADTVTVTLVDQDLNTNSEVVEVYTVVSGTAAAAAFDVAFDQVGQAGYGQNSRAENFGRLLDITFDDEPWLDSQQGRTAATTCTDIAGDDGLGSTQFTLRESGASSGVFTGSFAVPAQYCSRTDDANKSTTGKDLEVNYVDYRDASGEIIEVGDGAGVRGNSGTISLDRTVYPVPWGVRADYAGDLPTSTQKTPGSSASTRSLFPLHESAILAPLDLALETLNSGDVTVHVQVNDPDFNPSPTGADRINTNATNAAGGTFKHGPVKIMVQRGTAIALLATAGADRVAAGLITNGAAVTNDTAGQRTRELGPIAETSPDSGVFELDFAIRYTDGPQSTTCPTATTVYTDLVAVGAVGTVGNRFLKSALTGGFAADSTTAGRHCILQGDIITVEYRDPTDASGNINTVTDSATFDLRNGVIQSDKSVYIIGSDMILTLIEPDLDRDNDGAETYDLDLIEWDSDAGELTIGDRCTIAVAAATCIKFDPEPSNFRETGDSTGIFQIVIEIPDTISTNRVDRGEAIVLEYTDWGPSGANFVGEEKEDIKLRIFTSNFGATVELDQKVYTWTDKVFITVVAPDHNFDSKLVDDIGNTAGDPLTVATRLGKLNQHKLVETGTDTGIFTGEIILTGFTHDADGDAATGTTGNDVVTTAASGTGPTDGRVPSGDNDGLTISFEFNEDETVVGSALIRWNIGEVSWLEASYAASGTGVIRVIDPDMNFNPESVDNFNIDVWSDSDSGGIRLTVTETNEATGIFEGTVFFTTTDASSGHRLRVSEGDTVTGEYEDNTLPTPYTRADELEITGTAIIGTIVPPLERAPASNARVVDAFGNSLTSVSVDQQVQISADLSNGQDRDQKFAYLVQVQDASGVTVSLAWITGSLTAGQSFSPALSWIPGAPGTYTATVFVWESIDNPTALSPTVTTTINVS